MLWTRPEITNPDTCVVFGGGIRQRREEMINPCHLDRHAISLVVQHSSAQAARGGALRPHLDRLEVLCVQELIDVVVAVAFKRLCLCECLCLSLCLWDLQLHLLLVPPGQG